MDDWTEKTSRMLAKKTPRRGFLGWLGKASVALVGGMALTKMGQSVHAQGDAPDDICDCAIRYYGNCDYCAGGRLRINGDTWEELCQVAGWTGNRCYCAGGTLTQYTC